MSASFARSMLLSALCVGASRHPAQAEDPPQEPTHDAGAEAGPGSNAARLDALETELASVMDELVSARARAGMMARALFRTALSVDVVRRADAQQLGHLALLLDGAPVHDSDGSTLARDRARMFEGHVAPGMHELSVEVDERDRASGLFGYQRSERYRIEVKEGRRTEVTLILRDDSDMAEQVAEGDEGTYEVETELRVRYARGEP
jgi:hypothetical protein